jgi:hypothetical protein
MIGAQGKRANAFGGSRAIDGPQTPPTGLAHFLALIFMAEDLDCLHDAGGCIEPPPYDLACSGAGAPNNFGPEGVYDYQIAKIVGVYTYSGSDTGCWRNADNIDPITVVARL